MIEDENKKDYKRSDICEMLELGKKGRDRVSRLIIKTGVKPCRIVRQGGKRTYYYNMKSFLEIKSEWERAKEKKFAVRRVPEIVIKEESKSVLQWKEYVLLRSRWIRNNPSKVHTDEYDVFCGGLKESLGMETTPLDKK